MANIVAVIVTYNRVQKLKQAYIAACREPLSGIVIVNNASTDGTKEWLESVQNTKLTFINASENTGGAGGFHEGFKCALKKYNPDWIVCFDDDAYPEEGAIKKFINRDYSNDVGGVVSAVFLPNGDISEMNRPSIDPFNDFRIAVQILKKGTSAFHIGNGPYMVKDQIDVDSGSFAGLFIRSEVIKERIGLPRKELFLYGDDTIYTLLLRKAGYRLLFDPGLVFIHDTVTVTDSRFIYKPLWRIFYSYRNGLEIYRLVSGYLFPLVAVVKLLMWLYKVRFYDEKRTYLRMLGYGYLDGILRNFNRTHQEVKALERMPDGL
jgi:GT2 family glycosyltransferase